jgi:predicted secreted hydrolase
VTFFRVGVDQAPTNPSRWSVRDLYMTHVAVSDVAGQRYRFTERLSRSGPGLAGARADRYSVWTDDWSASKDDRGNHVLHAPGEKAGVDLVLGEGKGPVVNGVDGISQKGERFGNASHYYSITRMPTRGAITIDGERVEVTGESWMDHEFGTTFLEPEQRGWDWLSIQLADGRELMLYQLRRADGSVDPRSSGTLVERDGRSTHLTVSDFTLTPGSRTFRSSNGAVYPLQWTLAMPSRKLELGISTPLANQELSLERSSGVAYWEGVIDVAGREAGHALSGRGYLEMTGYHGSLGRVLTTQ